MLRDIIARIAIITIVYLLVILTRLITQNVSSATTGFVGPRYLSKMQSVHGVVKCADCGGTGTKVSTNACVEHGMTQENYWCENHGMDVAEYH